MIARARSTNEKKQTDIQNWQNQNEHEKWVFVQVLFSFSTGKGGLNNSTINQSINKSTSDQRY